MLKDKLRKNNNNREDERSWDARRVINERDKNSKFAVLTCTQISEKGTFVKTKYSKITLIAIFRILTNIFFFCFKSADFSNIKRTFIL